jgi:DNA uptake protein ComE-like DNA-binding protein
MGKRNFFSKVKNYFEYHKGERIGVLSLIILILIVLLIKFSLPYIISSETTDYSIYEQKILQWEKELNQKEESQVATIESFYFDPNSIDSIGFRKLGLTKWQTKTILNYRNKGGKFHTKNDFKKMYGLGDSTYQRLSPYLTLSNQKKEEKPSKKIKTHLFSFNPNTISFDSMLILGLPNKTAAQIVGYRNKGGRFFKKENLLKIYSVDSNLYERIKPFVQIPKQKKENQEYKSDTNYIKKTLLIELNSADTLDLQQLYGIGPEFARNIVKYRELLGGYLNKTQLKEVYGMTEERFQGFESQIEVNPTLIKKLNINTATLKQLMKHPYIDFSIAKRIILLKKDKGGEFKSISELQEIDMLYEALYIKIRPYLKIEE